MRNNNTNDETRVAGGASEVARSGEPLGLVRVMRDNSRPTAAGSVRVPWMDAEEAAAALGTTAHTLRRLAREGRSPALVRRVGGRWRWSRADVDRFVRGEPTPAA